MPRCTRARCRCSPERSVRICLPIRWVDPHRTGRGGSGHAHPDDRPVEPHTPGGAEERGVAEGEHASVTGQLPVPVTGRERLHADDRAVEPLAAHRPEEPGIAEGEHTAVAATEPEPA